MVKYLTLEQMHNLLKSRGLEIDDEEILQKVNYSHLIYKYGKHYLSDSGAFVDGTKISHIYNLYKLNLEISAILFKFISKFEHKLRVALVEEIASFGPLSYLNDEIYKCSDEDRVKTIDDLKTIEEKIRSDFPIEKLLSGKVPLWLLVDKFSIGMISWFIKVTSIDKQVSKRLKIDFRKMSILQTIKEFRNLIHHANPITRKIVVNHKNGNSSTHHLNSLYSFFKNHIEYRSEFNQLEEILNQIDKEKIGFSKGELFNMFII